MPLFHLWAPLSRPPTAVEPLIVSRSAHTHMVHPHAFLTHRRLFFDPCFAVPRRRWNMPESSAIGTVKTSSRRILQSLDVFNAGFVHNDSCIPTCVEDLSK